MTAIQKVNLQIHDCGPPLKLLRVSKILVTGIISSQRIIHININSNKILNKNNYSTQSR